MRQLISFLYGVRLAIDADDRFGVRLTEMYPTVGKVNLHAIDGSDTLVGELVFDTFEQCIHIHIGRKIDAVLGYAVFGIGAS